MDRIGEFFSWCFSLIKYYITCQRCCEPPKCQKCGLCKRCCCKCDDNDDKNIPLLNKNEINEPKLTIDTDFDDNNNIYKKKNDSMKASFTQYEKEKERKEKNIEMEKEHIFLLMDINMKEILKKD